MVARGPNLAFLARGFLICDELLVDPDFLGALQAKIALLYLLAKAQIPATHAADSLGRLTPEFRVYFRLLRTTLATTRHASVPSQSR